MYCKIVKSIQEQNMHRHIVLIIRAGMRLVVRSSSHSENLHPARASVQSILEMMSYAWNSSCFTSFAWYYSAPARISAPVCIKQNEG